MANENQTDGITIEGECNGIDSFFDGKGVEQYELLVVVPNSKSNVSIRLSGIEEAKNYKAKQRIKMRLQPTFFNGRLSGFRPAVFQN